MTVHVVQTGDSLWMISRTYNVPVKMIVEVNGLQSTTILPGLALYIPKTDKLVRRLYQVKAGDTLWQIARRFNTSISRIVESNTHISPNRLVVGQRLAVPSPNKMTLQTLGFLVPYPRVNYQPLIESIATELTYLAVVAYSFTAEGHAYEETEDEEIISQSKSLHVQPLLMIRNFKEGDFNRKLVGNVLKNRTFRNNLIRSIVNLAVQKGYAGVSIDFEFIPPPQRNDFIIFLRELKSALGDLLLHVSVHAKTEDIPTNPIIGAYDFRAIGSIADIVAVMTIDYGYPTGPPNPVSPLWWMAQVIRYSIELIDPMKLQIAFPLYGYNWRIEDNKTSALSVLIAQKLALSARAQINFDYPAAAPYFNYWKGTEAHIVWFEDIRSFVEKYGQIDLYNVLGVTFWHIGLQFPQNWAFLEENINVQKV